MRKNYAECHHPESNYGYVSQVQRNFLEGEALQTAYKKAVRDVATTYDVSYQTIGGACRRRLGLKDVMEFQRLLYQWTKQNPEPLVKSLKQVTVEQYHPVIETFFERNGFPGKGRQETEALTLQFAHEDLLRIRIASSIEERTLDTFIIQSACKAAAAVIANYTHHQTTAVNK